jgi:hypothetical protein
MKYLLLATSVLVASPALAELHPDPGMNTPSAAMLDPVTGGNPWTVSGGKANGNGAKASQMLMWVAPTKAGHPYRVTFTVSGMTHGVVEATLGTTMTGTVAGSYVLAAGFTPIADTFTTSAGLASTSVDPATHDDLGAFRITCSLGTPSANDPVVYRGLPGRSHLHTPWGNTQALYPTANYAFYRTHGGTTCGNMFDPTHPIARQAYWMPSMLDGRGNAVQPLIVLQYYKREPAGSDDCTNTASSRYVPGAGGSCRSTPQGLVYISGYNAATGLGGPASFPGAGHWACNGKGTFSPSNPVSAHLKDFFHGGCAKRGQGGNAPNVGGMLGFEFVMAMCWDGVNLDTPDHRSHMSYGTRVNGTANNGCPNSHPFKISAPNPKVYWEIDDDFVAGKWHLSSDEMVSGMVSTEPGETMHMDFTNAWSPTVQAQWESTCEDNGTSCGSGDLGNGTEIKDGGILRATHSNGDPDRLASGAAPRPGGRYYSTAKAGIGKPITSNGTYTQIITAASDGKISLMAIEDATGAGFDGQVDDYHVVPVP